MDIFIKINEYSVITEYTSYNIDDFQKITLPTNLLETNLIGWQFKNGVLIKPLQVLKEEKIKLLTNDLNTAKKITLQNGNTLIISSDTPERHNFMDNLNNLKKIEEAPNSILSYRQKEGDVYLGFSTLAYIWRRLFLELFTNTRDSKTLETKSFKNKEIYDVKKLKIENSVSIEELNNISWNFLESIVIDINLEAQNILDDINTPKYVKDAINVLKDKNGQIHLIQEL